MSAAPHLDAAAVAGLVTWDGVIDAILDGHRRPRPDVADSLLRRSDDTMLSRAAWIDGLGLAVKTATVFPHNVDAPAINGLVALYSDATGELDATIDFHLVTWWKTAADSLLAARRLARSAVDSVLIVGSGTVASAMVAAYRSTWPDADVTIWSRTAANARLLANTCGARVADDLATAVAAADVVSTSTMSPDPLIAGRWLRPGQHLDLIGGYRPDMRESDDECVERSTVFVDNRATAADVGDIAQPVAAGVLDPDGIVDFTELDSGRFARSSNEEITVFKNAGGAHLDLMVARHIAACALG